MYICLSLSFVLQGTLLHNPCDIMTQGLHDITWSDINIHATLVRYITNHATWIYDEVFSTQNLVPNMKFFLHQRPPRFTPGKFRRNCVLIFPKSSLKIQLFPFFTKKITFSLQCIHADRAVHFSVSWLQCKSWKPSAVFLLLWYYSRFRKTLRFQEIVQHYYLFSLFWTARKPPFFVIVYLACVYHF